MNACKQGEFSECAKGHVAYKPKVGDALMFYDLMPDYVDSVSVQAHDWSNLLGLS